MTPPTLRLQQHHIVVADATSLSETLAAILGRLDRLEQLITDEQGRQHDGSARSVDDGIVTPWDYYRGQVERLVLDVDALHAQMRRPTP